MKERKPNRLSMYDYSNPAWYYVTICTHNYEFKFGNISNGEMILNSLGVITDECRKNIQHLHKHIELDYCVIMPNHIHGIIIINSLPDKNIMPVGETNFASPTTSPIFYDRTKMELSKLLQQFKRTVTMKQKEIAKESDFKWQRSFYDRIIRNEKELYHIRKYIEQNPLKWELEKDIENLPL